jgi:putative ATPase
LGVAKQQHLPDELRDRQYYRPQERGHEREISARWEKLRRIIRGK